ncbi:helix-turn-helix domain-containing protein [Labrys sp. KNU-23]|uniref:helix-turn-helix domain-containing protein n=1 Tax=Labrys sp. KNU-23 TaxID=2789216 RepID=UPI00165CDC2F|nr:AraC family transcriptional regulator [Labrys sp. KNU-23]
MWGPQIFLDNAGVAYTQTGPNSIRYIQQAHTIHVHLAAEPQWEVALNSDRKAIGMAPLGAIDIAPATSEVFARWTQQKRSMRLDIDPTRLKRLACTEFENDTFELRPPKFGFIDKKAYTLSLWMQREFGSEGGYNLETFDALVTIYSIHLLRTYSSLHKHPFPLVVGGLPPTTWNRVRDFIYGNIGTTLTIEQLASVAQLSPSHFNRAFKQTAGQSPHQFVISTRLEHARNLVVTTKEPFSQIAEATGFSNNSHMTALMKRIWGMTPSQIRGEHRPERN